MNYPYTLEDHGDWLEKRACIFIGQKLPDYEKIWKIFIGHDGNGVIAKMNGEDEKIKFLRVNFSQYHYTVMESIYFVNLIIQDLISKKFKATTFSEYFNIINQMMSIEAYSGRLRDNLIDCFITIKGIKKKEALKYISDLADFYTQRNILLHGRKMPYALDKDKCFMIPTIRVVSQNIKMWERDSPWDSVNSDISNFISAEESYKSFLSDINPIVNKILNTLYESVEDYISKNQLQIVLAEDKIYPQTPVSSSNAQGPQSIGF